MRVTSDHAASVMLTGTVETGRNGNTGVETSPSLKIPITETESKETNIGHEIR